MSLPHFSLLMLITALLSCSVTISQLSVFSICCPNSQVCSELRQILFLFPFSLKILSQVSVFFFFFNKCVYFCGGGSFVLHQLFSSCHQWGCSSLLVMRWLLLLQGPGSGACGLTGCCLWEPEHRLGSCGTQALLFHGIWDPPWSGIEPVSPAFAGGFFTTEPPGKPSLVLCYMILHIGSSHCREMGKSHPLHGVILLLKVIWGYHFSSSSVYWFSFWWCYILL